MVLSYCREGRGFDLGRGGCISMEAKWWRPVCCAMSVHVKEPQIVKISITLHYSLSYPYRDFWDIKP